MTRVTITGGLAILLCLLTGGCFSQPENKDDFLARIRERGTREESRANPKPLARSKLEHLAPGARETRQIDEATQLWTYRLADGEVDLCVMVEIGNGWQDPDPMVFVDLKRTVTR